jgi:hypothetical protein
LGLYFLRARYLDVQSGRFWTQDEYEAEPEDVNSLHKFLYAGANPVNNIDPSGNLYGNLQDFQAASATSKTLNTMNSIKAAAVLITVTIFISVSAYKNYVDTSNPDRRTIGAVNLDTGTATALTMVTHHERTRILTGIGSRKMLMCQTAYLEFSGNLLNMPIPGGIKVTGPGPLEKTRILDLLKEVIPIPDIPTSRVMSLPLTRRIKDTDKLVFGTGDYLGIQTFTGDGGFVRAAEEIGRFRFFPRPFIHDPARFKGV